MAKSENCEECRRWAANRELYLDPVITTDDEDDEGKDDEVTE